MHSELSSANLQGTCKRELGFRAITHTGKEKETQSGVEVYCPEMQETFLVSVFVVRYSRLSFK